MNSAAHSNSEFPWKKTFVLLFELRYPGSLRGFGACFKNLRRLLYTCKQDVFVSVFIRILLFNCWFFCDELATESGPQSQRCRSQWTWKCPLSVEPTAGNPDLRVSAAGSPSSSSAWRCTSTAVSFDPGPCVLCAAATLATSIIILFCNCRWFWCDGFLQRERGEEGRGQLAG